MPRRGLRSLGLAASDLASPLFLIFLGFPSIVAPLAALSATATYELHETPELVVDVARTAAAVGLVANAAALTRTARHWLAASLLMGVLQLAVSAVRDELFTAVPLPG